MCFICAQRDPSDAFAGNIAHTAQRTPYLVTDDPIWVGLGLVTETVDAAESTATIYRIMVGQSATGTLASGTDEDWFAIDLVIGQSYDFRMLGLGAGLLSDPFVRVMDANGTQILEVDDGFAPQLDTHQFDTSFSFTATYTGTYYVQADAYSSETGSYLLTVTPDVTGPLPQFTVDEIAWQLINNGVAFFGEPEAVAFNVGADNSISVNITDLTADAQALATAALDVWSAYLGFDFVYVSSGAEMTFDDDEEGAFATSVNSGGFITSAAINVSTEWLDEGSALNSYAFETYLHEIGHALGLAHGGNYNGSANYGTHNYYANDSVAWSIMSYMQAEGDDITNTWNTFVGAAFQDMYTPMIADILAVQRLYGTSANTFAGNTTFGFDGTTGIAALDNAAATSGALMAMTIFDTGGTDTLNFSQTTAAQVISLSSESLSSVLGGRHNVGIARGVVIENAISGSGNDLLVGNGAANRLTGGDGDDTLNGGDGNDTLYGGAGDDFYILSAGNDVIIDTSGRNGIMSDGDIDLTIAAISAFDRAELTGAADTRLTGNALNNSLEGNSADNLIYGGAGTDTLDGGSGDDVLYGGSEADTIIGWAGGDTIFGGDGVDILSYAASIRAVNINLATNQARGGHADGDVIWQIEGVVGSEAADTLRGSAEHNYFDGASGNDTIYGGAGNDTIAGSWGKDALYGDAGSDRFVFNRLQDLTTGASTTDVIFGFTRGQDRIDLSTIDATAATTDSNDAFLFRGQAAFGTNPVGEIRFQQFNLAGRNNDHTLVYLDTDGDRTAEAVIKVMGLHNFAAADFIL